MLGEKKEDTLITTVYDNKQLNPRRIEYYDDRDVDNSEQIRQSLDDGCANLCLSCEACMSAICSCLKVIGDGLAIAGGEFYQVLIRPVGNAGLSFFKGKDGQYRALQPFQDIAMIPVNTLTTIADAILPIDEKTGKFSWPFIPILARGLQFFQLLTGFTSDKARIRKPLAAVSGLSFGTYLCLQTLNLLNSAFVGDSRLILTISPVTIIKNLMLNNPILFQKMLLGIFAYVGFTNGFVKGRDVALHEAHQWWNSLWADVSKDFLKRHLDKIQTLEPAIAADAEKMYLELVEAGKNWTGFDIGGRSVERFLTIPRSILGLPSDNIARITLPKAWLQNKNGIWEKGRNSIRLRREQLVEKAEEDKDSCAASIIDCLHLKNSDNADKNIYIRYPDHKELMEQREGEYSYLAQSRHAIVGLFSKDGKSAAKRKLDYDMEQRYLEDAINVSLGFAPGTPLLPQIEGGLPPHDPNWAAKAINNPDIQRMLKGIFPSPNLTPAAKALLYQEALYHVYATGQYKYKPSAPAIQAERKFESKK